MGFEYRSKDIREAEKLQKKGGHLIEIKGSKLPFEPKTYIFSETINQAKKMLGEKVEVVEEKPEEEPKKKGGKK